MQHAKQHLTTLTQQLHTLQHAHAVDTLLRTQHTTYTSLLPMMDATVTNHRRLMSALHASMHHVPVDTATVRWDETRIMSELDTARTRLTRLHDVIHAHVTRWETWHTSLQHIHHTIASELDTLAHMRMYMLELNILEKEEQNLRMEYVLQRQMQRSREERERYPMFTAAVV